MCTPKGSSHQACLGSNAHSGLAWQTSSDQLLLGYCFPLPSNSQSQACKPIFFSFLELTLMIGRLFHLKTPNGLNTNWLLGTAFNYPNQCANLPYDACGHFDNSQLIQRIKQPGPEILGSSRWLPHVTAGSLPSLLSTRFSPASNRGNEASPPSS